jgi:hypothetical protein
MVLPIICFKSYKNISPLTLMSSNPVHGVMFEFLYKKSDFFVFIWVRVIVFNTTFNNISVIAWWSVILPISGGNWRKPPNCRKSLTNFNK